MLKLQLFHLLIKRSDFTPAPYLLDTTHSAAILTSNAKSTLFDLICVLCYHELLLGCLIL